MMIFAVTVFGFSSEIISWFRDDKAVVTVGAVALQYAVVADILQPGSVASNMLLQSVGRAGSATFLSTLRTGICYIPLILILPCFFGVAGIEVAQPIADVLASMIALPFAIAFLREHRYEF